jgi:hypothetical protein
VGESPGLTTGSLWGAGGKYVPPQYVATLTISDLLVRTGYSSACASRLRLPGSSCSTPSAWRCRQFALVDRSDPNRRDDRISGFDQVRVSSITIAALYRDRSPADVRKDGLKRERLRAVVLVVRDESPIPLDQDV